jgi:hypothetical protein
MISELPSVTIPESITQLASLHLKNSRIVFSEIADIIESDSFLNLYVKRTFSKYLENGGILRMLTTLGWEGFRNRICEAYIFYARHGHYPDLIELDEIYDVLDIEKRFDFLFSEGDNHVFKFGFFLKLCDIYLESHNEYIGNEFISIPVEVDEILVKGHSRSVEADWLIIIVWTIVELIGADEAMKLLKQYNGDWNQLRNLLSESQQDEFYSSLLKYGHGINDKTFFIGSKV